MSVSLYSRESTTSNSFEALKKKKKKKKKIAAFSINLRHSSSQIGINYAWIIFPLKPERIPF